MPEQRGMQASKDAGTGCSDAGTGDRSGSETENGTFSGQARSIGFMRETNRCDALPFT